MKSDLLSRLRWIDPIPEKSEINARKKTKWCVITGGPASGKSKVIARLKTSGIKTVKEAAREYIDSMILKGNQLSEIRADELYFQRIVINMMYNNERMLNPDSLVYLDRGIPDGIAFYRCAGLDPEELFLISKIHIYSKIYLFEQVPDSLIQKDQIRHEDCRTSKKIELELEKAYSQLGYKIIRVPFMSVTERVEFILNG